MKRHRKRKSTPEWTHGDAADLRGIWERLVRSGHPIGDFESTDPYGLRLVHHPADGPARIWKDQRPLELKRATSCLAAHGAVAMLASSAPGADRLWESCAFRALGKAVCRFPQVGHVVDCGYLLRS